MQVNKTWSISYEKLYTIALCTCFFKVRFLQGISMPCLLNAKWNKMKSKVVQINYYIRDRQYLVIENILWKSTTKQATKLDNVRNKITLIDLSMGTMLWKNEGGYMAHVGTSPTSAHASKVVHTICSTSNYQWAYRFIVPSESESNGIRIWVVTKRLGHVLRINLYAWSVLIKLDMKECQGM